MCRAAWVHRLRSPWPEDLALLLQLMAVLWRVQCRLDFLGLRGCCEGGLAPISPFGGVGVVWVYGAGYARARGGGVAAP